MKTSISLLKLYNLTKVLACNIKKSHKIHSIVGISRGGIIPARYLANHLNVRRVYTLGIEFYKEDNTKRRSPFVYQKLSNVFNYEETVLIVDDIIDSGKSMECAIKEVKDANASDIVTCSVHYKPKSTYTPNFYGELIKNDVWIIYPWEINTKNQ